MDSLAKHFPNATFLPLSDNTKIPTSAGWTKEDLTKEALKKTNKGFATGNGIGVIDWDIYNTPEGETKITLQDLIDQFDTFTVETPGGGFHCYHLESDAMKAWGNKTKLMGYIDYRGLGGYVVAPGSLIDGKAYKVVHDVAPKHLEDVVAPEFFELANEHFSKRQARTDNTVQIDETVMTELKKHFTNIKLKMDYSFGCDQKGKRTKCPLCNQCHEKNYFKVYSSPDASDVYVKNFSERCKALKIIDGSKLNGFAFSKDAITLMKSEYQVMKEDFEKKIFQIRNPLCWGELQLDGNITILKKDDLKTLYCGREIEGKSFISKWMKDEFGKREYNKMDFLPPPIKFPTSTYNMWSDFQVEEVEGGECDTWVNLVNTLQIGKFVIDWFANIIQYPGKRSEVAIIITGIEGSGKNSLLLPIYKILGDDKWFATGDAENHLFGKFSNGLVRKLLVVLEETDPKQTFSNSEKLKTMITEPTIPYEGKGKDTITVRNLANFFGTSNFNRPVKLSKSDRRYVLDEMPDTFVGDKPYWKKYHVWLNNPANIWALYQFLLKRDLTKVDFSDRPITETFLDVQRSCLPMEIKFLEHLTYNFKRSWVDGITGKILFDTYKTFAGKAFENTSDSSFSRSLNKLNVPGILRLKPNTLGSRWKIDITVVRNWMLEKKYMVVQVYDDEPKVEPSVPLDPDICLIEDENFLNPDSSH
jgi:hypothetical protein